MHYRMRPLRGPEFYVKGKTLPQPGDSVEVDGELYQVTHVRHPLTSFGSDGVTRVAHNPIVILGGRI